MKKYLGIFALMMAMLLLTSMTCGALAEDWKWDQRVEIMVPAGEAVDWIQRSASLQLIWKRNWARRSLSSTKAVLQA